MERTVPKPQIPAKFIQSWKNLYPFVVFDWIFNEKTQNWEETMFCETCRKFYLEEICD